MRRTHIAIAAILLCFLESKVDAQRTTPVIRQVDHILVDCTNPKALFSLFADTLQLPVAWPISENQRYLTGGIGMGNTNIEFFGYSESSPTGQPETHFYGIAFEPYPLVDALRRLRSLGIPYSTPEPVEAALPNGSRGVAWTTVGLPSASKSGTSIFLYEYSPAFLRVDVRRRQLGNRLILNNGGPLGLESVCEIIIGSTDLKDDLAMWSLLLGKPAPSGNLRAGNGPAIRIVQDSRGGVRELLLKVRSLEQAKAFLKQNKLLGSVSENKTCLNPAKLWGLKISLTDKQ